MSDIAQEPSVLGRLRWGETEIVLYSNGAVQLTYPATCQVQMNTGEGVRENTASLYGRIDVRPRPASGTRNLAGPSAPTVLHPAQQ